VRASYIRELGIAPERIEVIYNSVDLSAFRMGPFSPSERKARRGAVGLAESPLLLNVARHTPQKGLLDLIAAMDTAPLRATGARLLLVGLGPDTETIRARVHALGLDAAVSLLGRRSDIHELMELSDVFVLPSIYEGLPLALLEALATGLPVVASDLPEIREVTGERGAYLVPAGQPALLAHAIASLVTFPEAGKALAQEGRLLVETRFDLRKNVRRFEAILRQTALRSSLGRDSRA
jgi:glycosyltransferase involved in cell wall biosynthesis